MKELIELLKAAKAVMAGLDARIDQATTDGRPVPVFDGIAALHGAIAKAEPAALKARET